MGWGDQLIYLGEVKHLYLQDGKKRKPGTANQKKLHASLQIWGNSPYIDLKNGKLLSEYINGNRRYYTDPNYVLKPAEITLRDEEIKLGDDEYSKGPYWIICPDNKARQMFGKNRIWNDGYPTWQELVNIIKKHSPNQRIIRLQPNYTNHKLDLVENIESKSIRTALALARKASLIITTEGFWHHLAAAWNVPAVVLYGGCTSPFPSKKYAGLGYQGQLNIFDTEDPMTPCYSDANYCKHCVEIWRRLTPQYVYDKLKEYIR